MVAARLGDDPTTVLKTYAHLLPRSDEQAATMVAAAIVPERTGEQNEDRNHTERR